MTSNIVSVIPLTMTVVSSGDTHKYCAEWAFTFDDLPAISLGAVSAVRRKVGPFVFQGGLTYLGRFALAHTMHILRSESQSLDTFSSETLAGR